jgi:hypothetical protein
LSSVSGYLKGLAVEKTLAKFGPNVRR